MIDVVQDIVRKAGEILLRYYAGNDFQVEKKGNLDYVSVADKETERFLVEALRREFPDAGIIAEEGSYYKGDKMFLIDPLDGTNNFIHHIPYFCISVALLKDENIDLGVVYDPIRDEMFTAERGKGARLNGKKICVSELRFPSRAVFSFGFPPPAYKMKKEFILLLEELVGDVNAVRWLGAAALDLAYVAAGRIDGTAQFGLKQWDVGAGALLIEEAGGIIRDIKGGENTLSGYVVAGNKYIYPFLQEIISRRFSRFIQKTPWG